MHQTGIGVDNVDVGYCTSKSIFVANVPLANAVSLAEHTLFLILYLSKECDKYFSLLLPGQVYWKKNNWRSEVLRLEEKPLTVVGLGATGLEVAKRAKSFGMQVIAVTRNPFFEKAGALIRRIL